MPPGRPREFDRDAALDRAMRLFWRKGFGDTSLDDLLAAMRIGRSSFYAAFKSKEAVFREALGRYCAVTAAEFGGRLLQARTARAFIESMLEIPVREARERCANGCLVMNSAAELGQRHAVLRRDVRDSLSIFERLFQQAVLRGQNEGSISAAADARALATYLAASLGGLRTMAKAGTSAERIRAAIPNVLNALE